MLKWFNIAKRLSELEDMMIRLSKLMDDRDLDWQDMRARCKRLLDRTEKAARRVVQSEEQQESAQDAGAATVTEMNGGGLLTPKQRLIQQQILRRRAGL